MLQKDILRTQVSLLVKEFGDLQNIPTKCLALIAIVDVNRTLDIEKSCCAVIRELYVSNPHELDKLIGIVTETLAECARHRIESFKRMCSNFGAVKISVDWENIYKAIFVD